MKLERLKYTVWFAKDDPTYYQVRRKGLNQNYGIRFVGGEQNQAITPRELLVILTDYLKKNASTKEDELAYIRLEEALLWLSKGCENG